MAAKKRFYKSVLLADDGLSIQLDGQNLRSPAGSLLRLPTRSLASAIADEWRAQGDDIDPEFKSERINNRLSRKGF